MKIRHSFVTNSSSSSYIFHLAKEMTAEEVIEEIYPLLIRYEDEYSSCIRGEWGYIWMKNFFKLDESERKKFLETELKNRHDWTTPKSKEVGLSFYDHDGSPLDEMGDYMLRNGFSTENIGIELTECHGSSKYDSDWMDDDED